MRAVAPYREGSEYCTMIARACKKLLGKKRAWTRIFLAHSLKKDRHSITTYTGENGKWRPKGGSQPGKGIHIQDLL